MKRLAVILLAGVMVLGLAACGSSQSAANSEKQTAETVEDTEITLQEEETNAEESTVSFDAEESQQDGQSNVLVAYFAYSENIGDTSGMSVDAIA